MIVAGVMAAQLLVSFALASVVQRARGQAVDVNRLLWRPACSLLVSTLCVVCCLVNRFAKDCFR